MKTIHLLSAAQSAKATPDKNETPWAVRRQALGLEEAGLAGTDVTFVSQSARAEAVRMGAGVMIGDYFVGVTTGVDLLFSHPAIVY